VSSSLGFLVGTGLIALISIPLILKLVPRNRVYGFKTPSTLSSDEIWFRANHFAGWALFIAAAVSATLLFMVPESDGSDRANDALLFVLPFIGALVASLFYLRRINREARPASQLESAAASSGGLRRRNSRQSRKS
jgi:SdpI/YhfL family protein